MFGASAVVSRFRTSARYYTSKIPLRWRGNDKQRLFAESLPPCSLTPFSLHLDYRVRHRFGGRGRKHTRTLLLYVQAVKRPRHIHTLSFACTNYKGPLIPRLVLHPIRC